jgi:hypothetical protein
VVECDTLLETLSTVGHGEVATVLPHASASRFGGELRIREVQASGLDWDSSLCVAEDLPLSRAAAAVFDLLTEVVEREIRAERWPGVALRKDLAEV